jgi:putative transposase
MFLSHKIELRPTKRQEAFLLRSVGIRRFVYNKLVDYFGSNKVKYNRALALALLKNLKSEYPWISKVSSRTSRNVLDDFDCAMARFFKNVKRKGLPGFPKFKKKGVRDSFSIREKEKFDVVGKLLRIEKLKTRIKMRQGLRFKGVTKQCTISLRAGKWFVSVLVECESPVSAYIRKPSVGVDIGLKHLAVLSDGTVFKASCSLKNKINKLAKLQKKLAKQKLGSNRRSVTILRLKKLYYHVSKQRSARLHELTSYLTKNFDKIVIEDLNVGGMLKNSKLSRAISDAGFGEFRTQLSYKAKLRDCELVIADRFFSSTKLCSSCGQLHDMKLSDRLMTCDCGLSLDRDLNAARNLVAYLPTRLGGSKCTEEVCKTTCGSKTVDPVNNVSFN